MIQLMTLTRNIAPVVTCSRTWENWQINWTDVASDSWGCGWYALSFRPDRLWLLIPLDIRSHITARPRYHSSRYQTRQHFDRRWRPLRNHWFWIVQYCWRANWTIHGTPEASWRNTRVHGTRNSPRRRREVSPRHEDGLLGLRCRLLEFRRNYLPSANRGGTHWSATCRSSDTHLLSLLVIS